MSRPQKKNCTAIVENRDGDRNIRTARVGKAPLICVWVHEVGRGGRDIILDYAQTEELIEGLNVLLDEFDDEKEVV